MVIKQFKNLNELYELLARGSFFHFGIWVGDDFALHYTSKKPALFYKGQPIAGSLKAINREMKFYGLEFVID